MPADDKQRLTGATARTDRQSEDALDDALRNTFPASDPVSILEPAARSPDRPVVETVEQARQGVTGHNVRYVLGYGIAGAVLAFVILYFIYASQG